MLLIVFPLTLVTSATLVGVDAKPIRFAVAPLPIVDFTIWVEEFSFAMSLIVAPLALIVSSVRPSHLAGSVPQATHPLAFIDGVVLVLVSLRLKALVLVEFPSECLA